MHNLIAGKPAPEIDGVGFDGKPLKLSDYRGKVVVLVFWGTWCGPCMREVPHERELAERLKDKPFAVLGVNCDDDEQAAAERDQVRADHLAELARWRRRARGRSQNVITFVRTRLYSSSTVRASSAINKLSAWRSTRSSMIYSKRSLRLFLMADCSGNGLVAQTCDDEKSSSGSQDLFARHGCGLNDHA